MDNTDLGAKVLEVSVLEVCHVAPSVQPFDSAELTLPLTFLDAFCFKFPPIQCLFFYTSDQALTLMASTVVPKLKHSLALTLRDYLPLAGTLTWPEDSPKPYVIYKPGDAVAFTLAESGIAGNFSRLSRNQVSRDAAETASLVPALHTGDASPSIVAFQVTLFPGEGFCVGISADHAFLDGKSVAIFMRSWAHVSKFDDTPLPTELVPFFDRTAVKDPIGELDTLYLNRWLSKSASGSWKSDVFQHWVEPDKPSDLVRCTFEVTLGEIDNLKTLISGANETLSSFIVVSAHVLTCMVKAMSPDPDDRRLYYIIGADYRPRLDPPVPLNYIGNCAGSHMGQMPASECFGTNGLAVVATKLRALVKGLEKGVLEGAEKRLEKWGSLEEGSHLISVTWSPKFRVYETDFGFGEPKKVEIASVHRKSISLVESSGGSNGGIEVGLVLKKHEMKRFASLFNATLKP